MPKIAAPTVAEHHRQRHDQLIAAATNLVAQSGVDSLTPAAVGAAAGLARSSVYQYFPSTAALVAAVVEDAYPRATAALTEAVERASTPEGRIDAYVTTALSLSTDPTYRSLVALASADLPEGCRARLRELHADQVAPLRAALAETDVSDPDLTVTLILGALHAAADAIAGGAPRARVERSTRDFLAGGVIASAAR